MLDVDTQMFIMRKSDEQEHWVTCSKMLRNKEVSYA